MRMLRPQQLAVIKSGYQIGRESRLGISVVAGCYLSQPDQFVSEAQIWEAWRSAPLSLTVLDAAEPKPYAEYLLAGHAGAEQPCRVLDVCATVGSLQRRWRVEGEGRRGSPAAAPFTRIPLDHPSAWGGRKQRENPLGRGGDDDGRRPLLMTVAADGSAQERSPLAAPTPVPHEFQLRKAHIDKVAGQMTSQAYLETVWPGLPATLDPRWFQLAPPAQWLSAAEWPAYVPFELQGFAAPGGTISGVLPAVRGRAFIRRHGQAEPEAVALQRKTLWFLPDSDIALIVFTGSVPLAHLLDESIELLLAALDHDADLRPDDYFAAILHKRSDPQASPFVFLLDPDLMPPDARLNVVRSPADHPGSLRYDPRPVPAAEAAAFYQRVCDAIDVHQQPGASPPEVPEPPDWDALPGEPPDHRALLTDPSAAELEDKEFSAVSLAPGSLSGKTFRRCRFLHCDFAAVTLENCTFEHCLFEAVDLRRSRWRNVQLRQCTLQQVALAESSLRDVTWDNVVAEALQGERLQAAGCALNDCQFDQATLQESAFTACTLTRSTFTSAVLSGAHFAEGETDSCLFTRCQARGMTHQAMTLKRNTLLGGDWGETAFIHCTLDSLTAGGQLSLAGATFDDCRLSRAGLKQTDLAGCRLTHCAFSESNFDQADLRAAQITACDMAGARFKDSVLAQSRWRSSSLQQGLLYNADLRAAQFEQCNLAGANLGMSAQDAATRFSGCLLERVCQLPRRLTPGGYLHEH